MRAVCPIWKQLIDSNDLWRFYTLTSFPHVISDASLALVYSHRVGYCAILVVGPFVSFTLQWKGLFKILYHGTAIFNKTPARGIEFLTSACAVLPDARSIAAYLHSHAFVAPSAVALYLEERCVLRSPISDDPLCLIEVKSRSISYCCVKCLFYNT